MRKEMVLMMLLALTLGCTTVAFHQPGKTAREFGYEMMDCRKDAIKSTPIEMYSGGDMDALAEITGKEVNCMREHGWVLSRAQGGFPFHPVTPENLHARTVGERIRERSSS